MPSNWEDATTGDKQIGDSSDVPWIPAGLPGAGNLLVFDNNQYLFERSPYSFVFQIDPFRTSSGTDSTSYVDPSTAGYSTETFGARDVRREKDGRQPAVVEPGGMEIQLAKLPDALQPVGLQRPAAAQRRHADLLDRQRLHGGGQLQRQRGGGVFWTGDQQRQAGGDCKLQIENLKLKIFILQLAIFMVGVSCPALLRAERTPHALRFSRKSGKCRPDPALSKTPLAMFPP